MHHPCGQSRGHNLISGLFHRGVSITVMCPSRGPPSGCSSPLGAYSSPAGHRIIPHNFTSPLYLPLSTCILVEHPPPHYAQRLDWVRGHDMPRLRHPTLTCSTVDTSGRTGRSSYIRELACATPTCISRQTRAAWSSGAALAALCCRYHARVSSQFVPHAVPPSLCCTHSIVGQ